MRIVIISDIHDNLTNLKHCLSWCKKQDIDELICCGDVTNSDTIDFLAKKFQSTIHLVQGNMEIYEKEELKKYKSIKYYGKIGHFDLAGRQVGLCHENYLIDNVLKKRKCDIVFYGHTHKPWIEKKKSTEIVNPGTLGGVFSTASFAYWEPDKNVLQLKLLNEI